jgi:predicted Fe-Mo cluster-binding NifX family protein
VAYNIALTSSDGEHIDLHFGHTSHFYILQVDDTDGSWELLEERELQDEGPMDPAAGTSSCGLGCGGHNAQRLQRVINILGDCRYLLTARIGPKPQSVLKRAGIVALEAPAHAGLAVSKVHVYNAKYGTSDAKKQETENW